MNDRILKDSLSNTPEARMKVSTRLHEDIMRAVRLAKPDELKHGITRAIPAWGMGMVALLALVVVFYPAKTTILPTSVPERIVSQSQPPAVTLKQLTDNLIAFSDDAAVPEKELRRELERLKSDLQRFDIRS